MKTQQKKREKSPRKRESQSPIHKVMVPVFLLIFALAPSLALLPFSAKAQAPANLIANPSVEAGTSSPDSWSRGRFSANTANFTYPTTGLEGSRAVRVDMTVYRSGDAKWYFEDVPVKPLTQYTFSDTSLSDVPTSVDIRYRLSTGSSKKSDDGKNRKFRYVKLGDVPAQSTATMRQFTFTTPRNVTSLTIFHLIDRVGYLVTDNFSLTEGTAIPSTSDTVAPTASITSPINGATVSGIVTISVNATDNVGVVGVKMVHSGTNHSDIPIGTEDTTAPYTFEWNTVGVANGVHMLQAKARDSAGNIGISATISVTVNNTTSTTDATAPTVSVTSPTAGATVSGTTTVSVTSSDNVGVTSNNLFIDGVSTASLGTLSPTTFNWNTRPLADGVHTLYAVAKDAVGNTATSTAVSVTVQNTTTDTTVPTISITTPITGATVYGTTTVSVTAADNVGVAGVSLMLDGVMIGSEDTVSPYSFSWNTAGVANGAHTLTAKARDTSGNMATSTGVSVTISN